MSNRIPSDVIGFIQNFYKDEIFYRQNCRTFLSSNDYKIYNSNYLPKLFSFTFTSKRRKFTYNYLQRFNCSGLFVFYKLELNFIDLQQNKRVLVFTH